MTGDVRAGCVRGNRECGSRLTLTPDAAQIYITVAGGIDGVVAVYDRASRALVRTIDTGGSPRRIAFDITGETAIVTNEASEVQIIK